MAPSRGKGKTRTANPRSTPAQASRSFRTTRNAAPDVYEEMLVEEAKRSPESDLPDRPLKRRRVANGVRISRNEPASSRANTPHASSPAPAIPESTAKGKTKARAVQTIEASSDDDSGDESDFAFEDVDLDVAGSAGQSVATDDEDDIGDISVSVDPSSTAQPRTQTRRRPATSAEKAVRLLTHKAHVLCLLGHCTYVNTWCNDINVQQHLHPLLSKKTLMYLRGKEEYTQFQRDRSFREGLEQASEVFRAHFKVNASDMRRPIPSVNGDHVQSDDDVDPASRQDLITAAREMKGSQDIGNQLFCALLRSAGVDARLVCSLQPATLASAQPKSATPQKPAKPVIRAMPPYGDPTTNDSNTEDSAVKGSSTIGNVPAARRRLGQPSFQKQATPASPARPPIRKRPVRKLDYPIFWVEAFNTAHQKWTPVDPLVTKTIGKPSKFEPPSSYAQNQMSYVIAFEEDGVARDVTRRYTKAYNAKTRRNRVESTENGTQWLKKALRLFRRRGGALDRDQTEDAELNQKEAREGLPGNVQDFKDHPVYALERHLKRHEIIEPKREVGKVNAGTAAKPRMEPVYRRSDVLICRSSDKWYRLGREIQQGQAPIKHVPARRPARGKSLSPDADRDEADGAGMIALYAQYQTEAYVAPPIVRGKVPRNAFGNLDIYVPSMVPPGGTHVRHALAQQAARILRVDYADAMTGFQFKGRHGTAIIQGAVVATQYAEAVKAVIDGLQDERLEEESLARSGVALRMWKRFLTGLRIKERINAAHGSEGEGEDVREAIDRQVEEQDEMAEAGGFFAEEPAMPTAGKFSLVEMGMAAKQPSGTKRGKKRREESESEDEAEFSGAETEGEVGSVPARRSKRARRTVVHDEDENEDGDDLVVEPSPVYAEGDGNFEGNLGGGFLPEDGDDESGGGGFVPQEMEDGQDENAGGFVPEDDGDGGGSSFEGNEEVPANENITVDEGGGFLPDAEEEHEPAAAASSSHAADDGGLADASGETVHVFEARADDATPQKNPNDMDDSLSMHGALRMEPEEQVGPPLRHKDAASPQAMDVVEPTQTEKGGRSAEKNERKGEEPSDHGSMLSHDPEDEDAEPDWLESD